MDTNDVYAHAVKQIQQHATPELVQGFREQMLFIRERYKHNAKTVDSCLRGMGDPPTLLDLLTAAFVVNGGVLFKHGGGLPPQPADDPSPTSTKASHLGKKEEEEELELSALMEEISELTRVTPPPCEPLSK
jgi:hypothetical protein